MSNKIRTGQISDIDNFVDTKDLAVTQAAELDATNKSNNAINSSNSYTDSVKTVLSNDILSGDNSVRTDLGNDITSLNNTLSNDIAQVLIDSGNYTDSEIISLNNSIRVYIEDQDLINLNLGKDFTTDQMAIYLATANSNAQYWDTLVLKAAQDYTDAQVGGAKAGNMKYSDAYSDAIITGMNITYSGTLDGILLAGVCYVSSIRNEILDIPHTFPINTDTYIDIDKDGLITYNSVANGGTVPALPIDTLRINKVVTDGTAIISSIRGFIISFYETDLEVIAAVQPELDLKESIINVDIKDTTTLNSAKTYTDNGLSLKESLVNKGVANGYAGLDTNGLVPSTQLPAYVDDVLEYTDLASFPTVGESGKIYVALDTNKTYRWSGTVYVYITSGAVDSVNGYTGIINLISTDISYDNIISGLTATNTKLAIDELNTIKASLNTNVDFTSTTTDTINTDYIGTNLNTEIVLNNKLVPLNNKLTDLGKIGASFNSVFAKLGYFDDVRAITSSGFRSNYWRPNSGSNMFWYGSVLPTTLTYTSGSTTKQWLGVYSKDFYTTGKVFTNEISANGNDNIGFNDNVIMTGFTDLGGSGVKIKNKIITGTTDSLEGGSVNIQHGLLASQILSYEVIVDFSGTVRIPTNFTGNSSFQHNSYIATGDIVIENITGNSSSILDKPVKIFITYTN